MKENRRKKKEEEEEEQQHYEEAFLSSDPILYAVIFVQSSLVLVIGN